MTVKFLADSVISGDSVSKTVYGIYGNVSKATDILQFYVFRQIQDASSKLGRDKSIEVSKDRYFPLQHERVFLDDNGNNSPFLLVEPTLFIKLEEYEIPVAIPESGLLTSAEDSGAAVWVYLPVEEQVKHLIPAFLQVYDLMISDPHVDTDRFWAENRGKEFRKIRERWETATLPD